MTREMGSTGAIGKAWIGAVLGGLAALAASASAAAQWPQASLTAIEVYDRQDGTTLPVYEKAGRRYIVGTPGHEYTLRVRNLTGDRILAVTSVDGVNVVTGETASPDQSGYVIDAYGSVEINGWRKSLERTAAFYCTDLGDSYAARTGRPRNVGVIGVAVFRERPRIVYAPRRDRIAEPQNAPAEAAKDAEGKLEQAAPSPLLSPPSQPMREEMRDQLADSRAGAKAQAGPLGTGHGRSETSYATRVTFIRATTSPAQMLSLQYDRRETLAAQGIIPSERHYARRTPEPFPGGLRFVPDPR